MDPADNDFTLRSTPAAGDGMATALDPNAGYFTFPNARGPRNADLPVKLVDACSLNSRY